MQADLHTSRPSQYEPDQYRRPTGPASSLVSVPGSDPSRGVPYGWRNARQLVGVILDGAGEMRGAAESPAAGDLRDGEVVEPVVFEAGSRAGGRTRQLRGLTPYDGIAHSKWPI
jgi:hypothetical protein